MTRDEAAAALDGNEYGNEGTKELFTAMRAARLVAMFGASDDLTELRGAIDDEVGSCDGGTIYLTPTGLLQNECDNERCPHFERIKQDAATVEALWCEEDGISWTYRTDIPHSTFLIKEGDETYCRGIVFSLTDAVSA